MHPHAYTVKSRKKTSHTFHLIMTLITFGGWLFIWIPIIMWNAFGPRKKSTVSAGPISPAAMHSPHLQPSQGFYYPQPPMPPQAPVWPPAATTYHPHPAHTPHPQLPPAPPQR